MTDGDGATSPRRRVGAEGSPDSPDGPLGRPRPSRVEGARGATDRHDLDHDEDGAVLRAGWPVGAGGDRGRRPGPLPRRAGGRRGGDRAEPGGVDVPAGHLHRGDAAALGARLRVLRHGLGGGRAGSVRRGRPGQRRPRLLDERLLGLRRPRPRPRPRGRPAPRGDVLGRRRRGVDAVPRRLRRPRRDRWAEGGRPRADHRGHLERRARRDGGGPPGRGDPHRDLAVVVEGTAADRRRGGARRRDG